MKLSDNLLIRLLAVFVAVALGIRLIYELLAPVWPYLLASLIVATFCRLWLWRRDRW